MEKAPDYIALAIPVFFLLIGLELLLQKLRQTQYYRFNDAITNISCGIGQQVLGAFLKTLLLMAYIYLYEQARFMVMDHTQWWTWVLLFIGVDFFYYWFHRYAHEISIMWGGHIVHHQSEDYNLSVALRQGAFQALFSWVFYLPLAFFGFHPVQFVVVNQFQTLYQFWIHTEAINRMPRWFEYIFNTPSHHRVHHGVNPKYIDKNHGGTLIIWDRMFGTFQSEEEPVVYGVTKPVATWNPVWANFDYFRDIGRIIVRCRNPLDMIRVLIKGPGWRPAYLGGPMKPQPVDRSHYHKFDTPAPALLNYYVLFQYLGVLGGASVFLFSADKMDVGLRYGVAALIMLSIASLGAMMEGRRWAAPAEVLRLAVLAGGCAYLLREHAQHIPITAGAAGLLLISILWLWRIGAAKAAMRSATQLS